MRWEITDVSLSQHSVPINLQKLLAAAGFENAIWDILWLLLNWSCSNSLLQPALFREHHWCSLCSCPDSSVLLGFLLPVPISLCSALQVLQPQCSTRWGVPYVRKSSVWTVSSCPWYSLLHLCETCHRGCVCVGCILLNRPQSFYDCLVMTYVMTYLKHKCSDAVLSKVW